MTSPHPNEVLPILPVNSVTYLPGCSLFTDDAPARRRPIREGS